MADKNKADRLGGEYMIQDRDHMSEMGQMGGQANSGNPPQAEQSQGASRQHGGDQYGGSRQQGGEKHRKNR